MNIGQDYFTTLDDGWNTTKELFLWVIAGILMVVIGVIYNSCYYAVRVSYCGRYVIISLLVQEVLMFYANLLTNNFILNFFLGCMITWPMYYMAFIIFIEDTIKLCEEDL